MCKECKKKNKRIRELENLLRNMSESVDKLLHGKENENKSKAA